MHHSSSAPHHLVLIVQHLWLDHSNVSVFSLAICLGVSLSISFLEASPNLHHICWHTTGALICTHHQEVIINREARMPPKLQVVWLNNWSPRIRCCCKPAGVMAGVAPTGSSCCVIACQSCKTASDGNIPPACYTGHGRLWFCTSGY